MRKTWWILVAAVLVVAAIPATADVVIHFTNGTTMAVRAYRFDDEMIHVDLGGNGQLAFPRGLVDRVEDPNRSLNLKPSTAVNQRGSMVAGSTTSSEAPKNNGANVTPPRSQNPGGVAGQRVPTNAFGLAVENGVPGATGRAESRLKSLMMPDEFAAANNNSSGNGVIRGTQQVGGGYLMPSERGRTRPRAVGVALGGDSTPDPAPVADQAADSAAGDE